MRHAGPAPGKLTHQGPGQEVTGGAFHHPRGRTRYHAGTHYRQGFNPCISPPPHPRLPVVPQTEWFKQWKCIVLALEAGIPESRCEQGWFLLSLSGRTGLTLPPSFWGFADILGGPWLGPPHLIYLHLYVACVYPNFPFS